MYDTESLRAHNCCSKPEKKRWEMFPVLPQLCCSWISVRSDRCICYPLRNNNTGQIGGVVRVNIVWDAGCTYKYSHSLKQWDYIFYHRLVHSIEHAWIGLCDSTFGSSPTHTHSSWVWALGDKSYFCFILFWKNTSFPVSPGLTMASLTRLVCVKALPSPCRVIAREEQRADGAAVWWLENGE